MVKMNKVILLVVAEGGVWAGWGEDMNEWHKMGGWGIGSRNKKNRKWIAKRNKEEE